jgi:type IV pilus assembly protein PilO
MALTLNFNKMPWYGQVGTFVALGLAGAGVFWNFHARDAQAAIDAKRAQLASIRNDIDRGVAITRRLPEFRKEVAQLELQLERLRAVLPEEQDVAELLRRVQGMATESNLTIRGFTPQVVAKKQLHMEWPIALKLEGRYHDLGNFLERVSKFPRIINVNSMKIRTLETPGTSGATISAEATATTFVLIDSKPAAPGVAPTPAAGAGAHPAARAAATE